MVDEHGFELSLHKAENRWTWRHDLLQRTIVDDMLAAGLEVYEEVVGLFTSAIPAEAVSRFRGRPPRTRRGLIPDIAVRG